MPEIADLKKDCKELGKDLELNIKSMVGIADIGDLVKHIKESLWPFQEAMLEKVTALVDITDEIDDAVLEMAEESGDVVTPETAGIFANVFIVAAAIAAALKDRLSSEESAGELGARITTFETQLKEANELLADSVVGDPDDDEDTDDDDK